MKVLDLLKKENRAFEEIPFTKGELLDAEEVFITSTTSEVMPVLKVDNQIIRDGSSWSFNQTNT